VLQAKQTSDLYSYFPNVSFRTFLRRDFYSGVPTDISLRQIPTGGGKVVRNERGTSMMTGPKGCEEDLSSQCSMCGRIEELFELPGRSERYCLGCSADIATASLLSTEIDAATLAGQNASFLISEYEQLGARLLERSQSAEFGNF
jgi:hypothetical protein